MKTIEQISKIKATLLYILKQIPSADYIKIFKVLYYAQQSHLVTYGRVVVEDSFNAQKIGPVPAFLYKALQSLVLGEYNSDEIKKFSKGIDFRMEDDIPLFYSTEEPDMDELSVSDVRCLDASIAKNKDISSSELSEISHNDKAWIKANNRFNKDPELGNKMTAIDIAIAGGAPKGVIEHIRENQLIDRILCYNG